MNFCLKICKFFEPEQVTLMTHALKERNDYSMHGYIKGEKNEPIKPERLLPTLQCRNPDVF